MERSKSVPRPKTHLKLPKIPLLSIHAIKNQASKARELFTTKAKGAKDFLKDKKDKTKKIMNKVVDKLDEQTNMRSTFFLVLIFFTLGNSLNNYLIVIFCLYLFLLTFRFFRFWVKNCLMYMLDFLYFGNILLIIFILWYRYNENYFLVTYSCATGVIALSIIVENIDVDLSSTDFITSTFFDAVPVLTTYAIRWKHLLYMKEDSDYVLTIGERDLVYDETLKKLIFLPFIFLGIWGLIYLILNGKIFRNFAYSEYFESSVCKFFHSENLRFLLGDHKKFTILKYITVQFLFLVISIPIVLTCFYNFYFNCGYIVFIILYLGFNSARNKDKKMELLLKKINKINQ